MKIDLLMATMTLVYIIVVVDRHRLGPTWTVWLSLFLKTPPPIKTNNLTNLIA